MNPDMTDHSGQAGIPGGPHMNALKHGLYSEAIVLPNEDVNAYTQHRLALFLNYRPQTKDEADLVEEIAESRWQMNRCRPWQARFDAQVVDPAVDAAGRICEPIGHKRLHSTMDVTVHRQRIRRGWNQARDKLILVQKQRRLGLIEGALKLPPGCYLETSGAVMGPVVEPVVQAIPVPCALAPVRVCQPVANGEAGVANVGASGSEDGGNRNSKEQKETPQQALGHEQGQAAPAGTPPTGDSGKPSASAQPADREPRVVVRRRPDSRGRLIGGVGLRRIFLPVPRPEAEAEAEVEEEEAPQERRVRAASS